MSIEELKEWMELKFNDNKEANELAHASIQTQVEKTNGRVRSLEKWRWWISGALFVISTVLSFMWAVAIAMVK